jgi:predicted metal-binding membrane protein
VSPSGDGPSATAAVASSVAERLLRRDRWVTAAGLVVIALLSWSYLLAGASMDMGVLDMTRAALFPHAAPEQAAMGGMSMGTPAWDAGRFARMLAMWWIMMIAMMIPSAAPMVLLYARVHRHGQGQGRIAAPYAPTAAFLAGYLISWLGFSAVAVGSQFALERAGVISAMMMWSQSAWLTAGVLIVAGVYQMTPLKNACLTHCRSPAHFLAGRFRADAPGALRLGVEHGVFCVGCCWTLMALLFVFGVMNLIWIAALAAFVLIEKLAPSGEWTARAAGVLLIVWGVAAFVA